MFHVSRGQFETSEGRPGTTLIVFLVIGVTEPRGHRKEENLALHMQVS